MSIVSSLKRIKLNRWVIVAALFIIAIITAHLLGSGRAATRETKGERAIPVTAAQAVAKPVPIEITAIGHIQPIATVELRPQIDGQITHVLVKDGQDVKPGDPIIQLDDRQASAALEQAQGNLAKDTAQLAFAQHEADRFRNLLQQSAGSREQMEQAVANAGALTGTVKADEAQVASDTVQLSYTTISAPIAGRIGTIPSKEGNLVQRANTTPLAIINQISPIYASFSVPEHDVSSLKQAMASGPVKVTVSAPGDAGAPEIGEIAYIENQIDPASDTLAVHATLPNTDERMWPGQFVNVVLTLRVEPNAIVVPSEAVQAGQDGSYVFVIKSDSTVESRAVTIGEIVGAETVIASGLKAGERVVTVGQLRLTPGARVAVQTQREPPASVAKGPAS